MKTQVAAFKQDYSICLFDFTPAGWVQLTEFVDVDLPDKPTSETLSKEIDLIDKAIAIEDGKHFAERKRLETRKQELLAIEEWKPLDFPVPDVNMSTDFVEVNYES
jgi:hypothetical protein